jgi:ureidoglycolate lyase
MPVPATPAVLGASARCFALDAAIGTEPINAGTTRRLTDLATLDVRGATGDPVVHVYTASARTFPLVLSRLERHREADQLFVPLDGQRFVVVVAGSGDAFDRTDVRACVTPPGAAVVIARGAWHHGLIALGEGDRFLVIEGGNYRRDCEERDVEGPLLLVAPDGA